MKIDMSFLIDTMRELIETPSPVGYYVKMKPVIERYAAELGLSVCYDNRNTAYITLDGEDPSKTVCISAHADTLGLMVRGFNADGTLRIRALGGVHFISCEGENVTVHTRDGREYTGMLICKQHSSHAYDTAKTLTRDEDTVAVLLDEDVKCEADVRALGIAHGDYISIDTRMTVTKNGFIKSRNIDDKAAMACFFAVLKHLKEEGLKPKYNTMLAFPFYEEIGFGGICVPPHVSELVSVDIGIMGPDSDGNEHTVTICAKDASMPYDYDLTNKLIALAEREGCRYAVDLFYRYGSDASQAIKGGNNVRHATFGMSVYCSHGVERTHVDGIENTAKLMLAYLLAE